MSTTGDIHRKGSRSLFSRSSHFNRGRQNIQKGSVTGQMEGTSSPKNLAVGWMARPMSHLITLAGQMVINAQRCGEHIGKKDGKVQW